MKNNIVPSFIVSNIIVFFLKFIHKDFWWRNWLSAGRFNTCLVPWCDESHIYCVRAVTAEESFFGWNCVECSAEWLIQFGWYNFSLVVKIVNCYVVLVGFYEDNTFWIKFYEWVSFPFYNWFFKACCSLNSVFLYFT